MASVFRYYENPPIHQVGDTKTSALFFDHAGWLLCDGRLLDKEYYNNLFNIIGTAFGESEDGTQFRIPNPAGRVPAIIGQAASGMNMWEMGDISGEEKHQLTIGEMPAHDHNKTGYGLIKSDGTNTTTGSITVGLTNYSVLDNTTGEPNLVTTPEAMELRGGNLPHNNIQPTIYMGNMFIYGGF